MFLMLIIPEISGAKSTVRNFGIHFAKLSSFQGRTKIAVPFVTGNFQKFKPEFWVEMKALFMNRLPFMMYLYSSLHITPTLLEVRVFYVKKKCNWRFSCKRAYFSLKYLVKWRRIVLAFSKQPLVLLLWTLAQFWDASRTVTKNDICLTVCGSWCKSVELIFVNDSKVVSYSCTEPRFIFSSV